MGEWREQVPRLAGDFELLGAWQRRERSHIMEPIRKLDEDDANVLGHREYQLTHILSLPQLAAVKDAPDLRQSVDDDGHRLAKFLADKVEGELGVFHHIMQ